MANPANYPENRAAKDLPERDSRKKEHYHNDQHDKNHSRPHKSQDDGSRNTRGRDYSKQNRDPERDARREMYEGKRSRVRDPHHHGHRVRNDEHRTEREYHKGENRDHHYKREREHHSQMYENSSHSKHQPNYRHEKEIPLPDDGQVYRHKNHTETVSPEYIISEDKRSEMHYFNHDNSEGILNCYKCRYLCTNRGLCQLVEVLLNLLILVCGAISYSGTGGYTDLSSLGSLYYYTFGSAYSGFQGAEAEKVKELDVAFYQLKLPTVVATMAYSGALMSLACLLLVLGLARIPWKFPFLMIIECVLDIAIAFGYIPAVYFYFQHLNESYNSQVCKEREAKYKSKGYEGFNCSLHGADIVGGLCGCLAIIVYLLNAVAAILGFRKVRRLKGSRESDYVEGINV
ncbi:MARVEL domain-containing protein 3-like [Hypanus sabinus]|uniref:MARVEL domain-containing protein 3-like n=1 Tax=Hypanus sabinus TaxID=79690 RepID=UPI0028C50BD4|nr:MARVEL domain-containing protein 3-like [Hypanus sabinus]XP_059848983.1 MARVEL domain-containing protein 3-like [Hypanus sabinus]XP_059848984.1 MARVEL domain-containing protein 3-like [Hypanus sabinus]XP_059848985.1 MARVEL domain-containing protein 3-like [Hypanus sabinus]